MGISFSVDRIDCGQTIDLYTGLFFCQLGTLEVRLFLQPAPDILLLRPGF